MEIVEYSYIDYQRKDERTFLIEKDCSDKLDALFVSLALVKNNEVRIEYLGEIMDKEMLAITILLDGDRKHLTCVYKDYIHEEMVVNFGSLRYHTLEKKTFIEAIDHLNAN